MSRRHVEVEDRQSGPNKRRNYSVRSATYDEIRLSSARSTLRRAALERTSASLSRPTQCGEVLDPCVDWLYRRRRDLERTNDVLLSEVRGA